jgi:hypothetical protein
MRQVSRQAILACERPPDRDITDIMNPFTMSPVRDSFAYQLIG